MMHYDIDWDDEGHMVGFVQVDIDSQWDSPREDGDVFIVEQKNQYFTFSGSPEHKWLISNLARRTNEESEKYLYGSRDSGRTLIFFNKSYAYLFYMTFSNG